MGRLRATHADQRAAGGRVRDERAAPASALAMQIVREASRADVSTAELGALAESDPAFALRVLALVNSPAYGFYREVSDTRLAVALIGIRSLRNLALSLTLCGLAPVGPAGAALLAVCIRRGVAARLLAEALGESKLDEHFTAGLFLEMGLLVWAATDRDGAVHVAASPAGARLLLERAAGRPGHVAEGAELARSWQLPDEMAEAIFHHHAPQLPDGSPLVRVAWLAERVAALFEGGDLARVRGEARDACAAAGLSDEAFRALVQAVPAMVQRAAEGFDRDLGPQPDLDVILLDANKGLVELNRHYEEMVRTMERLLHEREELTALLEEANRKLLELANTDGLTGLANKRAFEVHLQRGLARADRHASVLSLLVVDVDRFKLFNDRFGHQLGDEVLKAVARVLARGVRAPDIAARYGGEEFVVVLADAPPEGAMVVAERLRGAIEEMAVPCPSGMLKITASFGVASIQGPGCRFEGKALIERADRAMYEAKNQGRNRVVLGGMVETLRRTA